MAVDGRMAQVSTTGLAGASTACRKYAVSSSVSVPWVMTRPCTSSCASQWAQRAASRRQTSNVMSLLSSWATCSVCSGLALQRRNGRQQLRNAHLGGGVAHVVVRAGRRARNRPARAQNHNFLDAHLQTFKNWLKIQLLDIKTACLKPDA
jgi:hypothetical protein